MMNQNQKLENKTVIDTRTLPREEGRILFDFFEFLKEKAKERNKFKIIKREIKFQSWQLNSKDKLTRREIYANI